MFNGVGSLGGIAHQLMRDYAERPMKHANRMNLLSALYWTIDQQRTLSSRHHRQPCYIWWHLSIDEYGQIYPSIDYGPMSSHVDRMVYPHIDEHISDSWDIVLPHDFRNDGQSWPNYDPDDIMIRNGLSFGQQILSRGIGFWEGDYDESNLNWTVEVIYASPVNHPQIMLSTDFAIPHFKKMYAE